MYYAAHCAGPVSESLHSHLFWPTSVSLSATNYRSWLLFSCFVSFSFNPQRTYVCESKLDLLTFNAQSCSVLVSCNKQNKCFGWNCVKSSRCKDCFWLFSFYSECFLSVSECVLLLLLKTTVLYLWKLPRLSNALKAMTAHTFPSMNVGFKEISINLCSLWWTRCCKIDHKYN